jgi:hypothetical protein
MPGTRQPPKLPLTELLHRYAAQLPVALELLDPNRTATRRRRSRRK